MIPPYATDIGVWIALWPIILFAGLSALACALLVRIFASGARRLPFAETALVVSAFALIAMVT